MIAIAIRKTRTQETLEYICLYARDNSGITPSSSEIGDALGFSTRRASYLLMRLYALRKIEWVTKQKYRVIDSTWEPPPEVEI